MKAFSWIICFCLLSSAVSAYSSEKQSPYPHYWLSISTTNQSIPGMPTEMGGMASLFGGKNMFGPKRELRLQLESPKSLSDTPKAAHYIPPEQKMGLSLPLVNPVVEKTEYVRSEKMEIPEQYEKPKVRMLIYWGCGEAVGKGQPKVLDTATMDAESFGKAFVGRAPTHHTPPSPRQGWIYSEWPNKDDQTEIPPESSLVGNHLIKGNYIPEIAFKLDNKRDFMDPVIFSPIQKTSAGALNIEWKSIPTAIGYFATAIGHNKDTGESIFWSASEVSELGFTLQDYLTPGDINRFIKDGIILDPSKTTCTIPPIFKEGQPGMLQFIAYGEELNLSHPPKPKDPKQRWDIDWSAKVRLKSTSMMPLMAIEDGGSARKTSTSGKNKKSGEPKEEIGDDHISDKEETKQEKSSPAKEIGNRLRGIFGF